jgi:hypothetical protein
MSLKQAKFVKHSYSIFDSFCDVISLSMSSQGANLKGSYAALLILTRTLQGSSFLENAGAYSPEKPLSSINALPLSPLILAEWERT